MCPYYVILANPLESPVLYSLRSILVSRKFLSYALRIFWIQMILYYKHTINITNRLSALICDPRHFFSIICDVSRLFTSVKVGLRSYNSLGTKSSISGKIQIHNVQLKNLRETTIQRKEQDCPCQLPPLKCDLVDKKYTVLRCMVVHIMVVRCSLWLFIFKNEKWSIRHGF